jgi:voltage-gated potassium channel
MRIDQNRLSILYEGFLVLLAALVGGLLLWDLSYDITPEQQRLFTTIDRFVVVVYAFDYTVRLVRAPDKKHFLFYHLPELVAVIPFDRAFRLARLLRLQRVLPLLRAYRVLMFSRRAWAGLLDLLTTNNFHHIVLFTLLLVLLAAVGVMHFEAQVATFGEALWWSMVTLSTVGYGDIAPETREGRVIAVLLMILGVGLVAALTGTLSTFFIRRAFGTGRPFGSPPEPRGVREVLAAALKERLEEAAELGPEEAEEVVELAEALKRLVCAENSEQDEA